MCVIYLTLLLKFRTFVCVRETVCECECVRVSVYVCMFVCVTYFTLLLRFCSLVYVCVCVYVCGWVGVLGESVSVSVIQCVFVRVIECEDELLNGDVLVVAAQVSLT